MFFLLKFAFILLFVWFISMCAWPCSCRVTSGLDRWISDLTVQDALGKIHVCPCLLLLTVCLLFKPSDLRSGGYCVLDFKSYECCLFSLLCSYFLNPWIIWSSGCDELIHWLNMDLLIHQVVQIHPTWAFVLFIFLHYFSYIFTPLFFSF